eukprot:UN25084
MHSHVRKYSNTLDHIIYVFRYFWLDFMLFLTSKWFKNVNFGLRTTLVKAC